MTAEPLAPDTGADEAKDDPGALTIDRRVLAKVAAAAAGEIPDAGAAAPRVLARAMNATPGLSTRAGTLSERPRVTAELDGGEVALELTMSVRWPASVPAVTAAVRDRVRERITALTGMTVSEIVISVTDLVTASGEQARVH